MAKLLHWVGVPMLVIAGFVLRTSPVVCERDDVDEGAMHVLFVGNSYTSFNDLPQVVAEIAAANSVAMNVSYVMPDSTLLADHWLRTHARECIQARHFDAVVLQGNSLGTLYARDQFTHFGTRLAELARSQGAEVVWFATWPRHRLHPIYAEWEGGSPVVMNRLVEEAYGEVAGDAGGTLAPVGRAWLRAMDDAPELRLYDIDGSHPMPFGTLLAAFVVYEALTGTASSRLTHPPLGILPAHAEVLRHAANGAPH